MVSFLDVRTGSGGHETEGKPAELDGGGSLLVACRGGGAVAGVRIMVSQKAMVQNVLQLQSRWCVTRRKE